MKPNKLRQLLQKKKKLVILDVREKDEFSKKDSIQGSKNMPMGKVFVEASKGKLPKNKKIITVCSKGTRCKIVARELRKKGYDIEHLEGGLMAWKERRKDK